MRCHSVGEGSAPSYVPRHYRRLGCRQRLDEIGRGLAELDHGGERIGRLDLDHVGEGVAAARVHRLQELDRIASAEGTGLPSWNFTFGLSLNV